MASDKRIDDIVERGVRDRLSVSNLDDDIKYYDSDHTALVHVLWSARRDGLTIKDADKLASKIMQSKWMRAVRLHAATSRKEQP